VSPLTSIAQTPDLTTHPFGLTMRLKKVRLKNGYKRFRDLTIDLGDEPARVVALVGPNGCGKSSVLDGLLYHASPHLSRTGVHRGL